MWSLDWWGRTVKKNYITIKLDSVNKRDWGGWFYAYGMLLAERWLLKGSVMAEGVG